MNKLLTNDTKVGGFPLVLDDLRWFLGQLKAPNQQGIYQALNNLLRGFGDNFIVQGCVEGGSPGAITLTEGWILLDGELLKVDAQAAFDEATDNKFVKDTTFDSRGNKEFQNTVIEDTYEVNRGVVSGTSGNLAYNGDTFSDLRTIADFIPDTGSPSVVILKKKIIEIGDWDMQSAISKQVSHGISNFRNIRLVMVMIRRDFDDLITPLNSFDTSSNNGIVNGGIDTIVTSIVTLRRTPSGRFDGTDYNDLGFNRGWVTIEYEL